MNINDVSIVNFNNKINNIFITHRIMSLRDNKAVRTNCEIDDLNAHLHSKVMDVVREFLEINNNRE